MLRRTRRSLAAVTMLLTGALVSCSTDDPGAPPTAVPSPGAVPLTLGDNPGTVTVALPGGSIDAALAQLPGMAESTLAESQVPGLAVAVVHGGRTVFAEGYGVKELGKTGDVDAETAFQVASVSKPVGATVVATQVSQSVVAWDTPVRSELADFALADPWVTRHATIGDFYAHRSGLPHAAGDLLEDIGHDRDYVLDHLRQNPLAPFRSTYAYVNFGITVGAEAVARASGTDWATLSEEQLYGPLGMSSTSSRHRDFVARTNRAALHAKVDGRQPAIRPEMISSAATDVTARSGAYGYGFVIGVQPGGRVTLSHSGAFVDGAGTAFTILPSADLGIVVLTNGAPMGAAESLIAEFLDLVQFGQVTRDWPAAYAPVLAGLVAPAGDLVDQPAPTDPHAPTRLARYTGRYHNDYYGDAVVRERGGRLVMALGPGGRYRFDLEPWDGDTFAFVPTGENAPDGSLSSARFRLRTGEASAVTLGFFDTNGLGTWRR